MGERGRFCAGAEGGGAVMAVRAVRMTHEPHNMSEGALDGAMALPDLEVDCRAYDLHAVQVAGGGEDLQHMRHVMSAYGPLTHLPLASLSFMRITGYGGAVGEVRVVGHEERRELACQLRKRGSRLISDSKCSVMTDLMLTDAQQHFGRRLHV
jgi:hypothetical protein